MLNAKDFRRIALGMKDTIERAHMGHPDFRVNGRIFATLRADEQWGMVTLTPEQQLDFILEDPSTFVPEAGAWGRQGCTGVLLKSVDEDTLGHALTLAWQNADRKGPVRRTTPKRSSMAKKKAATIAEYLASAPEPAQKTLRELYATLKAVVPKATESIKWGSPVFEETRILFAFSAHKSHLNFMPTPSAMKPFTKELAKYGTGKGSIRFRYDEPLPKTLIRKIATRRVKELREHDANWM